MKKILALKLFIMLALLFNCQLYASPHFMLDDFNDFNDVLSGADLNGIIRQMTQTEWNAYELQWDNYWEGEPYPPTNFLPPELYVYEGDGEPGDEEPDDAGLVMKWGEGEDLNDGENYASAWVYEYLEDPDLSNSTIQITVTPPAGCNINAVSFALQDINGNRRSWWWSVPGTIPVGGPTTVTINTNVVGVNAANPVATGFMNTPGFDITKVQFLDVDENFQYIFGMQPPPPPGQTAFMGVWNYWHNLLIRKQTQTGAYKGYYIKWSQPVEELGEEDPAKINGWDERSDVLLPIMADDWECTDPRPVTDIHWWGSFLGWKLQHPPKIMPKAFHIGIWTDTPAGVDKPYSHPNDLVWENICDTYTWNFAGIDIDPRENPVIDETCFQFNQLLSEDEWFYQEPGPDGTRVYWLSIAAIYDQQDYEDPDFVPWGWKTRPHFFNDAAVRTTQISPFNLTVGTKWVDGVPIMLPPYPDGTEMWDLAFEITTNEQHPDGPSADIDEDGIVNFDDFEYLADQWLTPGP